MDRRRVQDVLDSFEEPDLDEKKRDFGREEVIPFIERIAHALPSFFSKKEESLEKDPPKIASDSPSMKGTLDTLTKTLSKLSKDQDPSVFGKILDSLIDLSSVMQTKDSSPSDHINKNPEVTGLIPEIQNLSKDQGKYSTQLSSVVKEVASSNEQELNSEELRAKREADERRLGLSKYRPIDSEEYQRELEASYRKGLSNRLSEIVELIPALKDKVDPRLLDSLDELSKAFHGDKPSIETPLRTEVYSGGSLPELPSPFNPRQEPYVPDSFFPSQRREDPSSLVPSSFFRPDQAKPKEVRKKEVVQIRPPQQKTSHSSFKTGAGSEEEDSSSMGLSSFFASGRDWLRKKRSGKLQKSLEKKKVVDTPDKKPAAKAEKSVTKTAEKVAPKAVEKEMAKTTAKEGADLAGKSVAKTVAKEGSEQVGKSVAKSVVKEGAKIGGKAVGKSLLKKVPLVGALAGAGFGLQRLMKGDVVGAGGELLSGIASTIPGPGTAASVAVDAALAGRDIKNASSGDSGSPTKSEAVEDNKKSRGGGIATKLLGAAGIAGTLGSSLFGGGDSEPDPSTNASGGDLATRIMGSDASPIQNTFGSLTKAAPVLQTPADSSPVSSPEAGAEGAIGGGIIASLLTRIFASHKEEIEHLSRIDSKLMNVIDVEKGVAQGIDNLGQDIKKGIKKESGQSDDERIAIASSKMKGEQSGTEEQSGGKKSGFFDKVKNAAGWVAGAAGIAGTAANVGMAGYDAYSDKRILAATLPAAGYKSENADGSPTFETAISPEEKLAEINRKIDSDKSLSYKMAKSPNEVVHETWKDPTVIEATYSGKELGPEISEKQAAITDKLTNYQSEVASLSSQGKDREKAVAQIQEKYGLTDLPKDGSIPTSAWLAPEASEAIDSKRSQTKRQMGRRYSSDDQFDKGIATSTGVPKEAISYSGYEGISTDEFVVSDPVMTRIGESERSGIDRSPNPTSEINTAPQEIENLPSKTTISQSSRTIDGIDNDHGKIASSSNQGQTMIAQMVASLQSSFDNLARTMAGGGSVEVVSSPQGPSLDAHAAELIMISAAAKILGQH